MSESSSASRLMGVLTSPTQTFESIARKPSWVLPFVVLMIVAIAATLVITPKIDMDEMIRASLADQSQEMSESQIQSAVEMSSKFTWVFALVGVLAQPVVYLLMAGLLLLCFRLMGSELNFSQSWGVTLHAFMPMAVAGLITIPVVMGATELPYEQVQAGSFLASNLGAFAPEGTSKPVVTLLRSFDVFGLWTLFLTIVGFRAAAKVSTGVSAGIVGSLWGVWVLGKVLLAAIF